MTHLEQAIKATGRTQYIDKDVLKTASKLTGRKIEFFTVNKYFTCKKLEEEYASRNLIPASIEDICRFDVTQKDEMDNKKYVATQWKDKDGNFCYAAFDRWIGGRYVSVHRRVNDWRDGWTFAGVPQVASDLTTSEKHSDSLPLELEINGVQYRRV